MGLNSEGSICIDETDKRLNYGSKMPPLLSQFKSEVSIKWGTFWLLRLGHSFQLKVNGALHLTWKLEDGARNGSKPELTICY